MGNSRNGTNKTWVVLNSIKGEKTSERKSGKTKLCTGIGRLCSGNMNYLCRYFILCQN